MLQNRIARFAVGAALALGGVGAVAAVGAAPASAATTATTAAKTAAAVHPDYWCSEGGVSGICTDILWPVDLENASDEWLATLNQGAEVLVECWYHNPTPGGDGYYDHIAWSNQPGVGMTSGHVDDNAVDFNNQTPAEVGLPQCAS